MDRIEEIREKIGECDDIIIEQLAVRMSHIQEIISYKKATGIPILQPEQEKKQTDALAQKLGDNEFEEEILDIFKYIMKNSRRIQAKSLFDYNIFLIGFMGAGKSTIMKLLLGLYKPQKGSVTIHGVPSSEIREKDRRKLFGYVEQSFHMVPGTVRDQITLYDDTITEGQVRRAAELAGLAEAIGALPQGYDTPCTPDIFSQGQWQLLSIARAVAADPKLLLLDEITANLDAETERAVLRALKRATADRTVLSISHRVGADTGRLIPIGEES